MKYNSPDELEVGKEYHIDYKSVCDECENDWSGTAVLVSKEDVSGGIFPVKPEDMIFEFAGDNGGVGFFGLGDITE